MKNVLVVANKDKKIPQEAIRSLCDRFAALGCITTVCAYIRPEKHLREKPELIVVLGGDGTIIGAARATAGTNIPIFGINYGTVGYMAGAESYEDGVIDEVASGNCRIERRMMLDVSVIRQGKEKEAKYHALNDAVLSNGPVPRILSFELHCNGSLAQTIRSDGMILATPTGSSAYSMSAGGPLVDPEMSCIVATPICPHSLQIRPVVFTGSSVLEIKNTHCRKNKIYLSVDGKEKAEILEGDVIRIRKSSLTVPLVRVNNQGFLKVLHTKLSDKR